jgi:hypothetical protein
MKDKINLDRPNMPADPADRRTADCLFFLFHADFQPSRTFFGKMIKKILILSLIVVVGAEFRFGGVSSQTGRPDLANIFPKIMQPN